MKVLCVFGEHAYGDPARGEGYEYVNFLPALRSLGHQVSFFESFSRRPYADFADLNRALLKKVEETSPDLVFCVLMQYEVWIETMRLIRESGPLLINWSTDDSWKYPMFSKLIGKEFDLYATTHRGLLDQYKWDGLENIHLSQWAASGERLVSPIPAEACRYSVSFVGSAYGHRRAMVEALQQGGVEVACFGHGWTNGSVEAKRISEIVQSSKISLNFSEGSRGGTDGGSDRQIKARIFEVPGYGGCLVSEPAPDLDRYFRLGEEILIFDGKDELVRVVKSLLAYPGRRDEVAHKGFERVKNEHTYDRRFSEMFRELTDRAKPRPRRPVDWSKLAVAAGRHQINLAQRLLRILLIRAATLIWGNQRGPRAARRLLFELSWRVAGSHTYSAAGWPGRIFYRES
ncbi:MAG TPA: glycosyltransferase [Nitrospiraceae bacterium]|jgi:spore maturation protein CgeB